MTAKERILLIRLTEKLNQRPAYAKALGLEIVGAGGHRKADPEGGAAAPSGDTV